MLIRNQILPCLIVANVKQFSVIISSDPGSVMKRQHFLSMNLFLLTGCYLCSKNACNHDLYARLHVCFNCCAVSHEKLQ